MSIVTIHEAKTHLSRLIQRALAGEEIVIAKRHEPLVKLQVIRVAQPQRTFGGLKYLVLAMGDSFDEELDDFAPHTPANTSRVAEPSPDDPSA